MARTNSKAALRLRQIKNHYRYQHQQWQSCLSEQLTHMDQQLYELRCSQVFYHRAMEALVYNEEGLQDNKEVMFGAFLISDQLLDRHVSIQQDIEQTQRWVNQHIQ